jgi:hypothetical protein
LRRGNSRLDVARVSTDDQSIDQAVRIVGSSRLAPVNGRKSDIKTEYEYFFNSLLQILINFKKNLNFTILFCKECRKIVNRYKNQ